MISIYLLLDSYSLAGLLMGIKQSCLYYYLITTFLLLMM